MKDLIIKLLAQLYDGTAEVQEAEFSIVGSCINFKVLYSDGDLPGDGTATWHTTCQHLEIVAVLQSLRHIKGHDPHTKQVFISAPWGQCARNLYEVLDGELPSREAFHRELLTHHLTTALHILYYEGDAEELVQFYDDYSLLEKQAWLWLMANRPSIASYHARQVATNLLNYYTGSIAYFPGSVPLGVQIFAKWLQRNNGGLFGQCRLAKADGDYTQTVA